MKKSLDDHIYQKVNIW